MKFTATTPVLLAAASFAGLSALPQANAVPLQHQQTRSPNPNSAVEASSPRLGDSPNLASPFGFPGVFARSPAIRSGSGSRRPLPYHRSHKRDDPPASPSVNKAEGASPASAGVGAVVGTVNTVLSAATGLGLGLGLPVPNPSPASNALNTGAAALSGVLNIPSGDFKQVESTLVKVLPPSSIPLGIVQGVIGGGSVPEILYETVSDAGNKVLGVVPVPDSIKETVKSAIASVPVKPSTGTGPTPQVPPNTPVQAVTGTIQGMSPEVVANILEALNPLSVASSIASKAPTPAIHPSLGLRAFPEPPAPVPVAPPNTPSAPAAVSPPWESAPYDHTPVSNAFIELDSMAPENLSPHPELPNPWDKLHPTSGSTSPTSRIGVVEPAQVFQFTGAKDIKDTTQRIKSSAPPSSLFPVAPSPLAGGIPSRYIQGVAKVGPPSTPVLPDVPPNSPVHPDTSAASKVASTTPDAVLSFFPDASPDLPVNVRPLSQSGLNAASTVMSGVTKGAKDVKDSRTTPDPNNLVDTAHQALSNGAPIPPTVVKDGVKQVVGIQDSATGSLGATRGAGSFAADVLPDSTGSRSG